MNPKEDHYSTQPQVSITTNKINNCLISPKPSLCLHLSHCPRVSFKIFGSVKNEKLIHFIRLLFLLSLFSQMKPLPPSLLYFPKAKSAKSLVFWNAPLLDLIGSVGC